MRLRWLCFIALAAIWSPAQAQSPAGPEVRLTSHEGGAQYNVSLQHLSNENLLTIWEEQRGLASGEPRFRTLGRLIGDKDVHGTSLLLSGNLISPILVEGVGLPDAFQVIGLWVNDFQTFRESALRSQRFSASTGRALGPPLSLGPENPASVVRAAARHASGSTLVAWNQFAPHLGVHVPVAQVLDAFDAPRSPVFPLYPEATSSSDVASVVATETGFLVFGTFGDAGLAGQDAVLRAVSLGGELGARQRIRGTGLTADIALAAAANDGAHRVAVIWKTASGLRARRYSGKGSSIGRAIDVNRSHLTPFDLSASSAMDPHGNFAVTWQSTIWTPTRYEVQILLRLFRANGKAVSRPVRVDQPPRLVNGSPRIAFGNHGQLSIAWQECCDGDANVLFRRFLASSGDEACVLSGGVLNCDGGRTGDAAEAVYELDPGVARQQLVFGDIDGDGRDDPCAWAHGRLRCDKDHEGRQDSNAIAIGSPGDTILLADWNGDGRDDPCLRRGSSFSCSVEGPPIGLSSVPIERAIVFGSPTDVPLVGDLDGNGRDELCVVSAGLFRCDKDHEGGPAEILIPFDARGGTPLLGDFDGNGTDDPCVFAAGVFSCDTAHDGGAAEQTLNFGRAGDLAFLPNLDGL